MQVKLTSSRLIDRVLIGIVLFTTLILGLHFIDSYFTRSLEERETNIRNRFQATQQWIRAEPPDRSFSVLMPQRPLLLTNIIHNPGGPLPTIQLGCTDRVGRATYIAAYTDFPDEADLRDKQAIYDKANAEFFPKFGKVRRDTAIIVQNIPGREKEVELHNKTNLMIERAFIADRRLYQLTAVIPLSSNLHTNTSFFLESLQFNTNFAHEAPTFESGGGKQ